MKKIRYAFWDDESRKVIDGEFFAIGFSSGSDGVCFCVDHFLDNIYWSWEYLKELTGAYIVFTVAAD